jgi:hypothetical protein
MPFTQTMDDVAEDLAQRSRAALASRRARGETMIYAENGWVYREHPGQQVERLCRLEDFKAADYPEPELAWAG